MGTRADFYVGRGTQAEWLGSIAWDGHPASVFEDDNVMPTLAVEESQWRAWVAQFLQDRDDATLPADGWPWPWDDSGTTDYAYAWDGGVVYASGFGHGWFAVDSAKDCFGEPDEDDDDYVATEHATFPRMDTGKYAPAVSQRSGVILFGV